MLAEFYVNFFKNIKALLKTYEFLMQNKTKRIY